MKQTDGQTDKNTDRENFCLSRFFSVSFLSFLISVSIFSPFCFSVLYRFSFIFGLSSELSQSGPKQRIHVSIGLSVSSVSNPFPSSPFSPLISFKLFDTFQLLTIGYFLLLFLPFSTSMHLISYFVFFSFFFLVRSTSI